MTDPLSVPHGTARGMRHFLDVADHPSEMVRSLLDEALAIAEDRRRSGGRPRGDERFMTHRYVTLLLEKPATRTRVHTEIATNDLGGRVIVLPFAETQLSRGETVADTARVLSRNTDVVIYRARRHEDLLEFARHSTVPVINACSDFSHPWRLLVDIMTFEQERGPISGRTVAWLGDGSNMLNSLVHAAVRLDFEVRIAGPEAYAPNPEVLGWAADQGAKVSVHRDPVKAIAGAHAVIGDTWVSMGEEASPERLEAMRPYQVDSTLMALAAPDAVYLHSLPAYRGQEVTADVIDGPRSLVWKGGIENKKFMLHALYRWLLRA